MPFDKLRAFDVVLAMEWLPDVDWLTSGQSLRDRAARDPSPLRFVELRSHPCPSAKSRCNLAARRGFEPRLGESKSPVLPLHHQAIEGSKKACFMGGSRVENTDSGMALLRKIAGARRSQ